MSDKKPFKIENIESLSKIAKALTMPRWHAEFLIGFDEGIANLMKVRPDLSAKLIKENVKSKSHAIGLYNLACEGKPMPWELLK